MNARRALAQVDQGEEYAAAVARALSLTVGGEMAEEYSAIEEMLRELRKAGLDEHNLTIERYLDSEHYPAATRLRLKIHTERGTFAIDLESPGEWREALREVGWNV